MCGYISELHPRHWREALPHVVNTINNHRQVKPYRGMHAILYHYFTQAKNEPVNLPQSHPKFFKYEIGEDVLVDFTKKQRNEFSNKYSLVPGKTPCHHLYILSLKAVQETLRNEF